MIKFLIKFFPIFQLDFRLQPTSNVSILALQGVDAAIRKDVWKYLLGYYSWHSTMEERENKRNALAYVFTIIFIIRTIPIIFYFENF